MAIAFLIEVPDTTLAQYDAAAAATHPDGHLPPGCLFHVAGPYEDGLRVVDVWESQEAFDTFLRARLQPALVETGMPQPRVQTWKVHNTLAR